jgi:Arc/MetJ-type ribon-helix-helix transcriptional regulator
MKLRVSLADEDVAFLDTHAKDRGLDSRSAALQRAVRLLRTSELVAAYESAWEEWDAAGSAVAWDPTAGDGLISGATTTAETPAEANH